MPKLEVNCSGTCILFFQTVANCKIDKHKNKTLGFA